MERNFINVILLGFAFLLLFTAFLTMSTVQKIVLDSIAIDDPTFTGDGYTSLAIIYVVFAIFNWAAPSVISVTGPRGSMFIGAVTYTLFIVSFFMPKTWLLYFSSVLLGLGAAIIWTGQGDYLSRCSDSATISRNSGVFWAMLQASLFFGNIFVYFQFLNKTHIDADTRWLMFIVLSVVSLLGLIFFAVLRPVAPNPNAEVRTALGEIKYAGKLFVTPNMLLLSVAYFYTGLELSFISGIYSSCIGFTTQFGDMAKQLVGLSGICIGIGAVIGGMLCGLLGSKFTKIGRNSIVIAGFIVHVISYVLIFLNLPNDSPFTDTAGVSVFNPPLPAIALICAFFLGFGDSCFNTQMYAMLGDDFSKHSAPAFALFKFMQSVPAALSFTYSSYLGLRGQLGILVGFSIIGTICFVIAERRLKADKLEKLLNDKN